MAYLYKAWRWPLHKVETCSLTATSIRIKVSCARRTCVHRISTSELFPLHRQIGLLTDERIGVYGLWNWGSVPDCGRNLSPVCSTGHRVLSSKAAGAWSSTFTSIHSRRRNVKICTHFLCHVMFINDALFKMQVRPAEIYKVGQKYVYYIV